jgi:hypothetical protein
MKRARVTLLMVVAGVFVFVTVVGLSLGAWFFAYAFDRVSPDPAAVSASLEDVRRRFAGQSTVLDVVDDDVVRVRRPPPLTPPPRPLERLNILTWNAESGALTSVTLPFWLLRMKAGPIDISSHVTVDAHGVNLTVAEVERYGPALLVDHQTTRGGCLLIWTE